MPPARPVSADRCRQEAAVATGVRFGRQPHLPPHRRDLVSRSSQRRLRHHVAEPMADGGMARAARPTAPRAQRRRAARRRAATSPLIPSRARRSSGPPAHRTAAEGHGPPFRDRKLVRIGIAAVESARRSATGIPATSPRCLWPPRRPHCPRREPSAGRDHGSQLELQWQLGRTCPSPGVVETSTFIGQESPTAHVEPTPTDRNLMLDRLGRFAARHRWWFIGAWIVLAVTVGGFVAGAQGGHEQQLHDPRHRVPDGVRSSRVGLSPTGRHRGTVVFRRVRQHHRSRQRGGRQPGRAEHQRRARRRAGRTRRRQRRTHPARAARRSGLDDGSVDRLLRFAVHATAPASWRGPSPTTRTCGTTSNKPSRRPSRRTSTS